MHQLDASVCELVLLDLGLPDGNGMRILAHVRRQASSLPFIILSARDTLEEHLSGLDADADDYLVKPFALAKLLSPVRALARRSYGFDGELLEACSLALHVQTRRVTVRYRLVTRRLLEEEVLPGGQENASNALDVHMGNLRRTISKGYVRTVRGIG
ncbi:response regulator [Herbaspirillum frisingense]|uniref:response regulator n=1 Tax=Herbaspirillum frisingense TaxID=92645 RepID=UPI001F005D4F|nr:response regulator [Herbaspirillum frisingense]